jgi:hypothetical protein
VSTLTLTGSVEGGGWRRCGTLGHRKGLRSCVQQRTPFPAGSGSDSQAADFPLEACPPSIPGAGRMPELLHNGHGGHSAARESGEGERASASASRKSRGAGGDSSRLPSWGTALTVVSPIHAGSVWTYGSGHAGTMQREQCRQVDRAARR